MRRSFFTATTTTTTKKAQPAFCNAFDGGQNEESIFQSSGRARFSQKTREGLLSPTVPTANSSEKTLELGQHELRLLKVNPVVRVTRLNKTMIR